MILSKLSIADQFIVYPMQDEGICIIVDITTNEKFECYQIYTIDADNYYISLVDEQIKDQNPIPEDIMIKANKIIDSLGGKEYLIKEIQELYNDTIEREKSYGYTNSIYIDLGKDNIRSYCIS